MDNGIFGAITPLNNLFTLPAEASVWLSVNLGGVPSKCVVSTVSISNINQIIKF